VECEHQADDYLRRRHGRTRRVLSSMGCNVYVKLVSVYLS